MIRFFYSIRDAARGIRFVFTHEQNFRIQIVVAIIALAAASIFRLRRSESVVIFLLILLVLLLELVNSAVEKILDVVRPRLEHQVKVAKDIMAATVLLAGFGALVIGSIIFWPHLIDIILEV